MHEPFRHWQQHASHVAAPTCSRALLQDAADEKLAPYTLFHLCLDFFACVCWKLMEQVSARVCVPASFVAQLAPKHKCAQLQEKNKTAETYHQ